MQTMLLLLWMTCPGWHAQTSWMQSSGGSRIGGVALSQVGAQHWCSGIVTLPVTPATAGTQQLPTGDGALAPSTKSSQQISWSDLDARVPCKATPAWTTGFSM